MGFCFDFTLGPFSLHLFQLHSFARAVMLSLLLSSILFSIGQFVLDKIPLHYLSDVNKRFNALKKEKFHEKALMYCHRGKGNVTPY